MKIDLWYPGEKIVYADCFFYPNDGMYCGNVYNEHGKVVGDYFSQDSVEIEKRFSGIFGD